MDIYQRFNFKRRRKDFIKNLPENSLVIIPNNDISIRSNDVEYRFKPDSDFFYLTGFDEHGSICVFKKEKKSHTYMLFVQPKEKEKEIWTGKITGTKGAKSVFKADEAYTISQFYDQIKNLFYGIEIIYFPFGKNKNLESRITSLINEHTKSNRAGSRFPRIIHDPRDIIHKMRLIKDSDEINSIQKAADISTQAHILAMSCGKNSKAGMYEHELEALIEYKFRSLGSNGPAYPSIVGSGENSTILHYIKTIKKLKRIL